MSNNVHTIKRPDKHPVEKVAEVVTDKPKVKRVPGFYERMTQSKVLVDDCIRNLLKTWGCL